MACVRASHPRHGSMGLLQSSGSMKNISCFGFVSSALQTNSFSSTTLQLQPSIPCPTSGGLIAYSSFSTPSLHPILGWTSLCRRRGGCVGRAAAPINCGENGPRPWPQPGSRAGLCWATQGQGGPKRLQENMQTAALKRQRLSFPSPLL